MNAPRERYKSKTLATWIALLGGSFGLHRFYLHGLRDALGWLLPWPTLLGAYGVQRARIFGLDDALSWLLIPLLGLVLAATSPAEAIEWAERVELDSEREALLVEIARSWFRQDERAAEAWLARSPLSEQAREQARKPDPSDRLPWASAH